MIESEKGGIKTVSEKQGDIQRETKRHIMKEKELQRKSLRV